MENNPEMYGIAQLQKETCDDGISGKAIVKPTLNLKHPGKDSTVVLLAELNDLCSDEEALFFSTALETFSESKVLPLLKSNLPSPRPEALQLFVRLLRTLIGRRLT